MAADAVSPLSRPFPVADLPPEGVEAEVEATPEEREALARAFAVPSIHALRGAFRVSGTRSRVHVSGRVEARVEQICVVSLDSFDNDVREDVEVDFAAPGVAAAQGAPGQGKDPPDEIVGGTIDLGALAAEFFALGLDPHPRKPGVDFTFEAGDDHSGSPFAALGKLKSGG
jgi:hypothetical protein